MRERYDFSYLAESTLERKTDMKTLIRNANLILSDRVYFGSLLLDEGKICEIIPSGCKAGPSDAKIIDAENLYISPGFIDLHTHGAGGSDYLDGTEQSIKNASRVHMEHGTTTLLPTATTGSMENLFELIDCFQRVKENWKDGPNMPGLHLEGPYFSPEQKGAQDERFLKTPAPEEYETILAYREDAIARWSVAPELPGAMEMGDCLARHGVLAAIGHSNAEYQTVLEAMQHGYSHFTHLYSGMSTIVRRGGFRYPGVLESAFILEDTTVELIADGCHIPEELLGMVYRVKGAEKICLITDSIRCAGTDQQTSVIGNSENGQEVLVEDGVAKLPDRSAFAGSIATADKLVRVMHYQVGVPLWDCVRMAAETPARIMGYTNKGKLAAGKDADLVFFNDAIEIQRVMVNGKTTYTRP